MSKKLDYIEITASVILLIMGIIFFSGNKVSLRIIAYIVLISALCPLFFFLKPKIMSIINKRKEIFGSLENLFSSEKIGFDAAKRFISEKEKLLMKEKELFETNIISDGIGRKPLEIASDNNLMFSLLIENSPARTRFQMIHRITEEIEEKDKQIINAISNLLELTKEEDEFISAALKLNLEQIESNKKLETFLHRYKEMEGKQEFEEYLRRMTQMEHNTLKLISENNRIIKDEFDEAYKKLIEQSKVLIALKSSLENVLKAKDDKNLRLEIKKNAINAKDTLEKLILLCNDENAIIIKNISKMDESREKIRNEFKRQLEEEKTQLITQEKLMLITQKVMPGQELTIGYDEEGVHIKEGNVLESFLAVMAKQKQHGIQIRTILELITFIDDGNLPMITKRLKEEIVMFINNIPGGFILAEFVDKNVKYNVNELSDTLHRYFNINPIKMIYEKKGR